MSVPQSMAARLPTTPTISILSLYVLTPEDVEITIISSPVKVQTSVSTIAAGPKLPEAGNVAEFRLKITTSPAVSAGMATNSSGLLLAIPPPRVPLLFKNNAKL